MVRGHEDDERHGGRIERAPRPGRSGFAAVSASAAAVTTAKATWMDGMRRDRVVELGDEAAVEVEPAHLLDRVDEALERARRRDREEEEDRLGAERRQDRRAAEAGGRPDRAADGGA